MMNTQEDKDDDNLIKVIVEELETGATLTRTGVGLKTIAPGSSDVFEFVMVSDGNSNQELDIVITGEAAEWAVSSITEIEIEMNLPVKRKEYNCSHLN